MPPITVRPVRQNIKTIASDALMGRGSWVKFRSMLVAEHTEYQSLIRGSQQLAQSKEATADDFDKNEKRLREIICGCVVEWNWVDNEGQDMPQPFNNPNIIELLTQEELTWLMESLLSSKAETKKKKLSLK